MVLLQRHEDIKAVKRELDMPILEVRTNSQDRARFASRNRGPRLDLIWVTEPTNLESTTNTIKKM